MNTRVSWPTAHCCNDADSRRQEDSGFKTRLFCVAFVTLLSFSAVTAPAASIFLNIPGIDGGQSLPAFPGSIAVQSLDIMPGQFAVIKANDSASPALFNAVANGTVFPSVSILLYNSTPTSTPDAILTLQNVIATSVSSGGDGLEHVSFAASDLGSMFLELPGITGESSTPDHPGVMRLDSFSLAGSQFSISKAVDSATAQIFSAVASGTTFANGSILFYDTAMPTGSPASVFTFGNVLGTSSQTSGGKEQDTFAFASLAKTAPSGVLANISTRSRVGLNQDVLIAGFIVEGTGAKDLVIRALGPTLGQLGVTGFLPNPTLELHDSTGAMIAFNDDWAQAANAQSIPANLQPPDNREAALLVSLVPGSYTAIVRGTNNTTGVALAEVYDIATDTTSRLSNISTRALVQTGANVMIAGVIIQSNPENVLVRALGPTLASFGVNNVLADPTLDLFDTNGTLIASNDDWKSTQQAEISATGKAPPNKLESALVQTVAPGNYTAIVRGVNNSTGVALVEVYALP